MWETQNPGGRQIADWKSVPGQTRTMPPSKGSGADFLSPKRELHKAKQGCTGEFSSVGSWNWHL